MATATKIFGKCRHCGKDITDLSEVAVRETILYNASLMPEDAKVAFSKPPDVMLEYSSSEFSFVHEDSFECGGDITFTADYDVF